MTDTAGHAEPQHDIHDLRHTLSVHDVETLFAQAGVRRSHRTVLRLCQSGALDAIKIGGPSGDEWFVSPVSVPKVIGDLKSLDIQRERRGASQPAVTHIGVVENPSEQEDDTARHGAPAPAMTIAENIDIAPEPKPAMARQTSPELDIYAHPYVKMLETRAERFEQKYDDQVRRTEEIQIQNQQMLVDMQRMTAVANSQTLADFMLKAKEWILGPGQERPQEGKTPVDAS